MQLAEGVPPVAVGPQLYHMLSTLHLAEADAVGALEQIPLEAMFLLGEFGVDVKGSTAVITALPEKIGFGDICSQGLPFYGGNLVYRIPVELNLSFTQKNAQSAGILPVLRQLILFLVILRGSLHGGL